MSGYRCYVAVCLTLAIVLAAASIGSNSSTRIALASTAQLEHPVFDVRGSRAVGRAAAGNPELVFRHRDERYVTYTAVDAVTGQSREIAQLPHQVDSGNYEPCESGPVGLVCIFDERAILLDGRSEPRVLYVQPQPARLDRRRGTMKPFITTSGNLYLYETIDDSGLLITAAWRLLRGRPDGESYACCDVLLEVEQFIGQGGSSDFEIAGDDPATGKVYYVRGSAAGPGPSEMRILDPSNPAEEQRVAAPAPPGKTGHIGASPTASRDGRWLVVLGPSSVEMPTFQSNTWINGFWLMDMAAGGTATSLNTGPLDYPIATRWAPDGTAVLAAATTLRTDPVRRGAVWRLDPATGAFRYLVEWTPSDLFPSIDPTGRYFRTGDAEMVDLETGQVIRIPTFGNPVGWLNPRG